MDKPLIILGAVVVAATAIFLVVRDRRLRAERLLPELLNTYFKGGSSLEQFGTNADKIAGRSFLHGSQFFALAVTAFQGAVNDQLTQPHSAEDERRLLGLFAALKTKFGLADLYQSQGWRAGRE